MSAPNSKIRRVFAGSSFILTPNLKKIGTLILRKAELDFHRGFIYKKEQISTTFRFDRSKSEVVDINPGTELMKVRVKIDKKHKIFFTIKLQSMVEVIAYLGGLTRGLTILFLALLLPIREILYYRKLMNQIFNVCDQKN